MNQSKDNSHSGQARKIPATEARFLGTTTPASLPQGETTENQKISKPENAPESLRSDEQGGQGIKTPLKTGSAAGTGTDSEKKAVGKNQAPKNWVQRALAEIHERKKEQLEREKVQALKEIASKLNANPAENTAGGSQDDKTGHKLTPAIAKAWSQYYEGERKSGKTKDKEIFQWLRENQDDFDEISFDTWSRKLRRARHILGRPKNQKRAGRTGRSIVTPDQI